MEGPISFWGYKEQESNLILPERDDDDDDDDIWENICRWAGQEFLGNLHIYLLIHMKLPSKYALS